MDYPDQRPPRAVRPASTQPRQDQQLPAFPEQTQQTNSLSRSPIQSQHGANVSFQNPVRPERQRTMPSPYHNNQLDSAYDPEQGDFDPSRVGRKRVWYGLIEKRSSRAIDNGITVAILLRLKTRVWEEWASWPPVRSIPRST